MRLLEVTDAASASKWLALPNRLHAERPAYIGPLENEVEAVFDPAKNPRMGRGEAIRWLAISPSGRAMGRVAAFLDREAPDVTNPNLPTGGIGFFECLNNTEAATLLLDAARDWLAARGMQAMDGPINYGDRDRFWGLLIDGFEWEPNYGMFWHPPYYQALFETYGFQVYFKQYTCYRSVPQPLHPGYEKRVDAVLQAGTYRLAHAHKADPEKLAIDFQHVYNLAWARHTGVAEMTAEQARHIVQEMAPVADEQLLWFAYHGDEPVGFFLALPELNQVFKHIGRRLNWLGKARFLWHQWRYQRRRDKKMLGIIYGVVPAHQGHDVDMALASVGRRAFEAAGYTDCEMNWIGDFNPRMLVVIRAIGAKVRKTHATYRYLFDRKQVFERYPIIR